jgi:hypothetical protein
MEDWSPLEVELVVADYLAMLAKEMAGEPYNKSAYRRALQPLLNNRSEGSIEFKRQNVSAALIELGAIYIKGYLPRFNRQELLVQECAKQLQARQPIWEIAFTRFTDTVAAPQDQLRFEKLLDDPPEPEEQKPTGPTRVRKPFKVNYLEREQRNTTAGELGEKIAVEYERWRLMQAGKSALADKVEWVAAYDDGAGFDILSKQENGADKYIEVKSTKLS